MNKIEITKIGLSELEQLQQIGRQTFHETFAEVNTKENMQKYLDESFAVDKLTAELTTEDSEFYFAGLDNRVIGYLKVNFGRAQTELQDPRALELERIYVLKEFHRKRVGQILYNTAHKIAKRIDADYIWLGVWEKNQRAISFYRKNGFVEFDRHIFKLGNDVQTDIMMKLKLDKD